MEESSSSSSSSDGSDHDDHDENDSLCEVFTYKGIPNERIPFRITHAQVTWAPYLLSRAFMNHEHLKKIVLWEGLQEIGDRAFYGCIALRRVKIPPAVTRIYHHAFNSCENLKEVQLSEGLQDIGAFAFYRCHKLEEISIPASTTTIRTFAFSACSSLVSVKFQEEGLLSLIGGAAFCRCSALSTISIPSSVEIVEEQAFSGCSGLLNLELPDSGDIRLSKWAFKDCEFLVNLEISSSIYNAFKSGHMPIGTFEGNTFLPLIKSTSEYKRLGDVDERTAAGAWNVLFRLTERYERLPIHKICSSSRQEEETSLVQLQEALVDESSSNEQEELLDCCEMTPFHALATSANMRLDYLNALLEAYPVDLITAKDQRGNTMIDYLLLQGPTKALPLFQLVLKRTLVDGIHTWGLAKWKSDMKEKVNAFRWKGGIRGRREQFSAMQKRFASHVKVEMTSLLELALWKRKMIQTSCITTIYDRESSAKRQKMDRDALRTICGSDIVMVHVTKFLADPSTQIFPLTSFRLSNGVTWMSGL